MRSQVRDPGGHSTSRVAEVSGGPTLVDLELEYDDAGNIEHYGDAGYRHLEYYAAYDELHRLRCVSRSAITGRTGSAPWEDRYLEVFSYDASGNRTGRRYGQYTTGDEDLYTYVTDSDIIDQVSSRGVTKQMSNTFRGELSQVNQPHRVDYTHDAESRVTATNDNFLGSVTHNYTGLCGCQMGCLQQCADAGRGGDTSCTGPCAYCCTDSSDSGESPSNGKVDPVAAAGDLGDAAPVDRPKRRSPIIIGDMIQEEIRPLRSYFPADPRCRGGSGLLVIRVVRVDSYCFRIPFTRRVVCPRTEYRVYSNRADPLQDIICENEGRPGPIARPR